jgi:hypothetical protein
VRIIRAQHILGRATKRAKHALAQYADGSAPNGPTSDAKAASARACNCAGMHVHVTLDSALRMAAGTTPASGRKSSTTKSGSTSAMSARWKVCGMNGGGSSQLSGPNASSSRGQYNHWNCAKTHVMKNEAAIVPTAPPTKPSTVFFGESCINGVRPKLMPAHRTARQRMQAQAVTRT